MSKNNVHRGVSALSAAVFIGLMGTPALSNDDETDAEKAQVEARLSTGAKIRSIQLNSLLIAAQVQEAENEAKRIKGVADIAKNTNSTITEARNRYVEEYALELAKKYPFLFLGDEIDINALNSILAAERSALAGDAPKSTGASAQAETSANTKQSTPEEQAAQDAPEPTIVLLEAWGLGDDLNATIELPSGRQMTVKFGTEVPGYGTVTAVTMEKVTIRASEDEFVDVFAGQSLAAQERQRQALVDEVRKRFLQQQQNSRRVR